MTTATHAKPANEPARRLYSHVVVPPHLRRPARVPLDNDSLREAVNQYINANENDYTEKGLRYRYEEECGCNDPQCHYGWCPVCNSERSAAEDERRYRDWVWRTLKCVGLEEPVTERSGAMDAVIARHGPIEEWDVSKVTNMRELFRGVERFNDDLSKWDVSNVTDMCRMFECAFAFNRDLSAWDVSNVTDMSDMFTGAESFNGDLSKWDVSNVTDMCRMFDGAGAFKGDLSKWDVSKVTNMRELFCDAESFNDDLSKWDVSNVTDMGGMFLGARAFNGDLSKWDVSKVTDMSCMFEGAHLFNGDLSKWDVSNVEEVRGMFRDAKSFNGNLSKWDVSKVTDMSCMFEGAHLFNGDLSKWDVSNVEEVRGMFRDTYLLNPALPPELLKRLMRNAVLSGCVLSFRDNIPARRYGRWLWRLVRYCIRPHVLTRLVAYYWMELGARPDAEGNAPRGAIEAFCEDFAESCPWWSES